MNDLVSIVTPAHNSSAFISETVESILNQDYPFFELLIVDDCSSDDTWQIISGFSRRDKRIKCFKYDYSIGPAIARNAAIFHSKGRFIAFCDSDDIWHPSKLSSQLMLFDSCSVSVVFSPIVLINEASAVIGIRNSPQRLSLTSLYYRNFIPCSSAVYDTSLVGKVYMPSFSKRQDYGLWLTILSQGYSALSCDQPFVFYRIRSRSVSSNKFLASLYHFRVLRACTDLSFIHSLYFFFIYVFTSFFPSLTRLFVEF